MNPTGQPFNPQFGAPPPPGGGGGAREAVNVPSLLLMVFGVLGVLFGLVGLVSSGASTAQVDQLLQDPNLPPEAKKAIAALLGPGTKMINLFGVAIAGLMTFGAFQMRNLKSYGLAVTACVLGMLPCTNCCCVTLPIGIWALTVIMRPEVKSSFS
jgi:hypothetical protein